MLPTIISTLALCASLSAAFPAPESPGLHVPLVRRSPRTPRSTVANAERFRVAAENLRYKYGYKTGPRSLDRRQSTTGFEMGDEDQDASYSAVVSIGTPAQTFNLVLDTGSSDLWFATTACNSCPSGTPELNVNKSSSYKDLQSPISLTYGSGNAAGVLSQDTVSMGPYTISNQTFTAITDISSGLIDGPLAGIMGLAFQGLATSNATPFWQALVSANQWSSPEFSFFMERFVNDTSATKAEPGGILTLGGTNSSLFQGNIDFQPFPSNSTPNSFWVQELTSVTINGTNVTIPGGNQALAAIDTGTSLIGGPTAAVQAIWSAIPGSQPIQSMPGYFGFPCGSTPAVSFSFGGPSWPISPSDFNLGPQQGTNLCMGAIFDVTQGTNVSPGDGTPAWIIGDSFLKNVYTVFRANPLAVGFAQLSGSASSGTPGAGTPNNGSGTGTGSSPSKHSAAAVAPLGAVVHSALLGIVLVAGAQLLSAM